MKNFIRKWLGINDDMQAISQDITLLHKDAQNTSTQLFGIFHGLPFMSNVLHLQAKDAAAITDPSVIQRNNLPSLLLGVIINARLGQSSFEVTGELTDTVAAQLRNRGFKVEDHEGSGGKSTFIIWT